MNLVTIDNKKLWSKNKKNLLVGDWCINNDHRFKKNKKVKYFVSEYHWSKESKLEKDLKYLQKVYILFLNNLCKNLNEFHNWKYPIRYWEILLHKWLWAYLVAIFDRWEIIRSIRNKNKSISTKVFRYKIKNFVPKNSFEFGRSIIYSEDWNHWIFSKIIKYTGTIQYRFINKSEINPKVPYAKKNFKDKLNNHFLNFPFSRFSSNKIFTQSLYFSKELRFKFDLLYRQFGYEEKNIDLDFSSQVDFDKRDIFLKLINGKDSFVKFAYGLVKYHLPKIFFEDYKEKIKSINKSKLPEKPKIVATAVEHNYDDPFKLYIAQKVLKGSKFYIFQHGASYGISKFNSAEKYEARFSDKLFTWGWKNSKKTSPLFVQQVANKKIVKKRNASGLIIPVNEFYLQPTPNFLHGNPRIKMEVNKYIDNIILFLSKIDKNVLNTSNFKYVDRINSKYVLKSLKFKFPNIKFIKSTKNTYALSNRFKLTVETINSTGFLESLNLNIPVILILDRKYCPIRKSALKHFEMLKKVKIIHSNPTEAADFVNKRYSKLEEWWNGKSLQKARNEFCYKFARQSGNPLKDLKKVLN